MRNLTARIPQPSNSNNSRCIKCCYTFCNEIFATKIEDQYDNEDINDFNYRLVCEVGDKYKDGHEMKVIKNDHNLHDHIKSMSRYCVKSLMQMSVK